MIEFTIDANIFNLEALGSAIARVPKIVVEPSITTTNTNATAIRSPVKCTRFSSIAPTQNLSGKMHFVLFGKFCTHSDSAFPLSALLGWQP